MPLNHDLHASAFQLCDTQHAGEWESYLPWRKERHPQRVCFQASICSKCFASQTSDLQACSEGLNSRVRAVSPCAFQALETHSWVRAVLPMRKKAAGVCLRSGAMMGSPGRGHLAHQMVPRQGVTDQPLAGDIPKRGAKLAGSEGGKQQWDGIFKQLLGHTALGLPGERCELWLLGPISRGHAQGVSLQDPGMFQTDLGSLAVARLHRFRCPQEKQAPCGP